MGLGIYSLFLVRLLSSWRPRRNKKKKESAYKGKKCGPPPAGSFLLSHFQPPSIPDFDLEKLEFLSDDDPAVFIDYASDADIHAVCGLAGSPVAQAANPATTADNLRAWVRGQFLAASPFCTVMAGPSPGTPSTSAFQRLSNGEFFTLQNGGAPFIVWMNAMVAAGASLGRLYAVTPMLDGGGGRSPQAHHVRGWLPFLA